MLLQWMFRRESSKSLMDMKDPQRLADCVGVSTQANGDAKNPSLAKVR